ncbi:putative oxidoreductase C19A8.06 [Phytophthora cinnamomi]|uniref:putative oxidoreductase C19A8.06 n=1 Tax=Phytophthora cinnamomi TaxID=4785 RepID=UPI002A32568E|nr:putative oxidoreductase C19A8.06 [Phytophthora cinnamomi]KAJ8523569.1 hypothetical protein ON010_g17550 [Phytophthora cinnamomi]
MSISPKHALIVGASSGIGLAMAHKMAPLVTKLTLCSRSCPPDLVLSIKEKNPNVEVEHERLDMSLLHDVRRFTTKHAKTRFDWILLTAGILFFREQKQTSEGLDDKLATMYYARFMLVHDLLPNLNRPGVRVLCVLAAGQANITPNLDDLDLKHSYSMNGVAHATVLYLDLMMQALSEHAPNATFMHIEPGFVNTNLVENTWWYIRIPMKIAAWLVAESPEKNAKGLLQAFTKDEYTSGWKLLNKRAEEVPKTKFHTDELKDIVWNHTLQTIDDVLKQ